MVKRMLATSLVGSVLGVGAEHVGVFVREHRGDVAQQALAVGGDDDEVHGG
jgi:hypothetical protein